MAVIGDSQRNFVPCVLSLAIKIAEEGIGEMFFVSPNAVGQISSIVSESQEHVRAFSSVGLERYVDIVEVTGSSPVLPI
jgi:hypothetical protein